MKSLLKVAKIKSYIDRGSDGTKDPRLRYDIHKNGKNIAYSVLRPTSTEGDGPWISGVYVDPKHRGKGLSRKIMSRIEKDHPGQTLRLRARPYKDKSIDTQTLMKIYGNMGYSSYDPDEPTRMMKKAQKLYHGSPRKLYSLKPQMSKGKDPNTVDKAVFSTDSKDEAALYALLRHPDRRSWGIRGGKGHYLESDIPLNESGYVYSFKDPHAIAPEMIGQGYRTKKRVWFPERVRVFLKDHQHLMSAHKSKEDYKKAVR